MPAIGLQIRGNAVVTIIRPVRRRVQSDLLPGENPIFEFIPEVQELRERVVIRRGLQHAPHVVRVGRHGLGVLVVGGGGFDGGTQDLVPEELADVRHRAGVHEEGVVGERGDVHVCEEVRVRGAAVVVAREDCVEGGDAGGVGGLDPAEVGAVVAAGGVVA